MTFLYVTAGAFWVWLSLCFGAAAWSVVIKRKRIRYYEKLAEQIVSEAFAAQVAGGEVSDAGRENRN